VISFDDVDWTSPAVLKVAGGALLWLVSDSRALRMAGLGLAGWGAWDYWQNHAPRVIYQSVPLPKGVAAAPWAHPSAANLGRLSS
jgi:hypothetical protein